MSKAGKWPPAMFLVCQVIRPILSLEVQVLPLEVVANIVKTLTAQDLCPLVEHKHNTKTPQVLLLTHPA